MASAVVLLRALEGRGEPETENGHVAIGWLIVEDLFIVLVLVLLPALAGPLGGEGDSGNIVGTLALALVKAFAFVLLMLFVGARVVPWLLGRVAGTGSRELFTLAVLALALGIAFGSAEFFSVSLALGAFLAGAVVNGSELSHRAAEDALPMPDAFAMLFVVSVGMLIDPALPIDAPGRVFGILLIIIAGKALAAFVVARRLRRPVSTGLVAAGLAQVGEFSFILAGLGGALGTFPRRAPTSSSPVPSSRSRSTRSSLPPSIPSPAASAESREFATRSPRHCPHPPTAASASANPTPPTAEAHPRPARPAAELVGRPLPRPLPCEGRGA